jgi:hypothetical protein
MIDPLRRAGLVLAASLAFLPWAQGAESASSPTDLERCGTLEARDAVAASPRLWSLQAGPADCDGSSTAPPRTFVPMPLVTIPVVVHVIMDSACAQGVVSDALVHSQIDVLNEDYRAIPGSHGGAGRDAHIQFALATEDPGGNPTTGITRDCNTTWFNDQGNYFDTLAWDPHRYMNIYTNTASGARGYVPFLPADGGGSMVGTNADRVVINFLAFGRPGPTPPYDNGRTTTHETGHFFGLYHPYLNACGTPTAPGCLSTGDLICDTPPDDTSHHGCATGQTSCGGFPIPAWDYMELSDDLCMTGFTSNQGRRMRCTLTWYRTDLAQPARASSR